MMRLLERLGDNANEGESVDQWVCTLEKYLVDEKDFKMDGQLACGMYGDVYRAKDRRTDNFVALKIWKGDHYDQKLFLRGVTIPLLLDCPGIVKCIGFQFPEGYSKRPVIVAEFMPNGTLGDAFTGWFNKSNPKFGATEWSKALFGVAVTMAYVHEEGIIHRDLKPWNVFLDDLWEPRIGGFFLARHIDMDMGRSVGTPLFMAPELFNDDEGYDRSVDIFAFGVLCYQGFTTNTELDGGQVRGAAHYMMRVMRGQRLKRVPEIPDHWWDLITRCWAQIPDERPTFREIVVEMSDESKHFYAEGTDMEKYREYKEKISHWES